MVALLVAIAVVFVSRFFSVLVDLHLDLSPSPPTHTRTYKGTSHTDYLSLYFSRYYQTVVVNAVMALLR